MEIRRAATFDGRERSNQRQLFRGRRERRDAEDLVVECVNRRAVVRRESIEHVACAALRFLERHAGHRAGAIENQREVQRPARPRAGRRVGRLDTRKYAQRRGVPGCERGPVRR